VKVRTISLLILLSVAAGRVAGQQPTTTLQGNVMEAGTNTPLTGASLELRALLENPGPAVSLPNSPIPYFQASSTPVYPGLSGDAGQFVFRNIPPGRYTLTASHNGHMHAEYGQHGPNGKGMILTVAGGQPITGIRLAMTRSGAISGHVYDNKAAPLAYVQVQMRRLTYPDGQRTLTTTSSTVTDDRGAYRLYGLPPGAYVMSAETNTNSVGIIPVGASRTPPVPGVVVFQSASGPMTTDPDPANQNRRRDPGLLIFYPNATDSRLAKTIDIRAGDDIAGINVTLNAVRSTPVAVTWNITGTSNPSNSIIELVVSSVSNGGEVRNRFGIPPGLSGPPVLSLPSGSYLALAMERGSAPEPSTVGYAGFDVGSSTATRINIGMTPTRRVAGHLVGDGPQNAVDPADIAGLRINFRRNPPIPLLPGPPTVTPGRDGTFSVNGFTDGDWEVLVTGFPESPRNAYVKSIRVSNTEVLGNRIHVAVEPDGPMALEIVIGANGGQLSGTAIGSKGEPLPNVTVLLAPDVPDRRELYRAIVTDAAGHYHFGNLSPGSYQLFSWEDVEPDAWYNPAFMATLQDVGKKVRISEGSRESVDVNAIPIQ